MAQKKPSTPRDIKKVFSKIEGKLAALESAVEKINNEKIPRDPSLMVGGSSPMYRNHETAVKVMENPDIPLAIQYVKNTISKALKR